MILKVDDDKCNTYIVRNFCINMNKEKQKLFEIYATNYESRLFF